MNIRKEKYRIPEKKERLLRELSKPAHLQNKDLIRTIRESINRHKRTAKKIRYIRYKNDSKKIKKMKGEHYAGYCEDYSK
jgi:hypothetical protein